MIAERGAVKRPRAVSLEEEFNTARVDPRILHFPSYMTYKLYKLCIPKYIAGSKKNTLSLVYTSVIKYVHKANTKMIPLMLNPGTNRNPWQ